MDTEEFRHHGHIFVDWMADYLAGVEKYPVMAQVKPGEITAKLASSAPEQGEPMEQIFADFQSQILPGITHWQHPSFFAFFPANSSPPSVLAEMLTATIAPQCMLWQTSPAATEMETQVLDWLRQMIGLPEGLEGVIQDSASSACLCALLTARERATEWRGNLEGLGGMAALCVYVSEQVHSSAEKDVMVAGLGSKNLRKIPVDDDFAMLPDALVEAIQEDVTAGRTPCCVIATLGSTGVGAVDPLRPIGEICQRYGIYLHVDAAWAGSALVLPEWRWIIDGVEAADSFAFNPHKWLFTNFDCCAHFVRSGSDLVRTLDILPTYLKTREGDQVIDYRNWGVPLGRRFRALKLWFVLRSYGVAEIRRIIASHIQMAGEVAAWMEAAEDFEILAPLSLALFNFRFHPKGVNDAAELDRLNERLLLALNDSGDLYLTQNNVRGAFAIRFAVGQTYTEPRHVAAAWQAIQNTAWNLA